MNTHIKLPKSNGYQYLELPLELQRLIDALRALESATAALDTVEHNGRLLAITGQASDMREWRNRQADSFDAYTLCERVRCRAELAYAGWLIERKREEGASDEELEQILQILQELLRLLAQAE